MHRTVKLHNNTSSLVVEQYVVLSEYSMGFLPTVTREDTCWLYDRMMFLH